MRLTLTRANYYFYLTNQTGPPSANKPLWSQTMQQAEYSLDCLFT